MLLTEEEAKEKWCPQAYNGSDQKCVGSYCMTWRWNESSKYHKCKSVEPDSFGNGLTQIVKWYNVPEKEWEGYCGLAGKP